jgi:hypothetical protein
MSNLVWQKPYVGPFTKKEAEAIIVDLKRVANPEVNSIHNAEARSRGGESYDVYVLVEKDEYPEIKHE